MPRGTRQTVNPFVFRKRLRGRTLTVLESPETAVDRAVQTQLAQGFTQRPEIPPTLVVSAARWLGDGRCEPVMMPLLSFRGDSQWNDAAAIRLDPVLEALFDALTGEGELADVRRPQIACRDRECPANLRRLRTLMTWP